MGGPSGSALPPSACPPTPVRALRAARRRGGRHCAPPRHGNQLHCFSPLHALRGAEGEGDHYGAKVGGGGGGKGVVLVLFLPQGQCTRAKTRTLTISLSGWQWRCAACNTCYNYPMSNGRRGKRFCRNTRCMKERDDDDEIFDRGLN